MTSGYRALYDHTMRTIQKGEEYASELEDALRIKSTTVVQELLASTLKGLDRLRGEVEEMEELIRDEEADSE